MRSAPAVLALALLACTSTPTPVPDAGEWPESPDGSAPIDAPTEPAVDAGADAGLPPDARPGDSDAGDITTVPPHVDGRLVINEFMASNALSLLDETNAPADWIESYNPTDTDVPLAGYLLTDDLMWIDKVTLGNVTAPAGGYLLLWADRRPSLGPHHIDLRLQRESEHIALARPDGSFIDRVEYGEQARDFAAAREPDGSDRWVIEWHPSPGAANPNGSGAPAPMENASLPPEMVPAAGDLSEQILGYDALPSFELLIDASDIASLTAAPRQYVPGMLVYRGRSYGPIGVRLKGQNSFLPIDEKPSLRLNIDYYVPNARFFGIDNLTLNNMSGDLSMMHERLAYWVFRNAGIPASRANHLLLTVNGQFYGLYANVETVKKQMIARWFADNTGPLFEGTDVDFLSQYVSRYELEAGPDDRSMLTGAANALTVAGDAGIAGAANFIDMSRFHRFWGACSVIGQFDSFPYSQPGDDYFVYADPTSDRLAFLPWGMDETFQSGSHDVTLATSILAQRCKESASCFDAYRGQTYQILTTTEQIGLAAERLRVMGQIAPYTTMDTRKPYTNEQVTQAQGALRWFIAERRDHLNTMLAP
jgi:hypothetical protein